MSAFGTNAGITMTRPRVERAALHAVENRPDSPAVVVKPIQAVVAQRHPEDEQQPDGKDD